MVQGVSIKTLELLSVERCQIFNGLKRCDSKNAVLRCNKKSGKSVHFYKNAEVAEKPHRFGRHRSKLGLNPNVVVIFQESMHRYMGL